MASTLVQIRVDEDLKNEATSIFEQLGLDLPTAFRIFLKKSVEERGIPFSMRVNSEKKALKQANNILKMANKEAKKNKIQNLTLDEINAEISAYRKEK
ncbi:MAG: type II toxin-antitoxin system RelB/DinJ family antitoxin [Treponema sp.]|uniref:type II toxin-antitoxin system RelB/DinJ family antitoxin n=1 Tax=Treponema sp. TaxID=166 RepID=UPI0025F6E577|nr:type II toxin-antitoxin system RelB/DinJ family antitoxin [uncultured Treponema sp.]MEE0352897.1 type II toxin-antitoxin system RelB/DinJ family antitoxin [Treponema sp.]